MGNSIDWLISRIETVEGRINNLENKLIKLVEIIQTKHKGEKRVLKKENTRKIWTIISFNIWVDKI